MIIRTTKRKTLAIWNDIKPFRSDANQYWQSFLEIVGQWRPNAKLAGWKQRHKQYKDDYLQWLRVSIITKKGIGSCFECQLNDLSFSIFFLNHFRKMRPDQSPNHFLDCEIFQGRHFAVWWAYHAFANSSQNTNTNHVWLCQYLMHAFMNFILFIQ